MEKLGLPQRYLARVLAPALRPLLLRLALTAAVFI
jgi:hypothetical protein